MTDEQYEAAINANAARAAISRAHGDEISGDYWWEQAQMLSDQREVARARLDSYTQEQHAAGIQAARERAIAKQTDRRERAKAAADRLREHCDTFDVLKGSPDHSSC